ncbi:DUF6404 family protein [Collimonas humicola]
MKYRIRKQSTKPWKITGAAFGLAMAFYYRHGARKYQLPQWPE